MVGRFSGTGDVSGVVTGSSLLNTLTMIITGLSMGVTILVGEAMGRRNPEQAGRAICQGILLFFFLGLLLTFGLITGAPTLAHWFQAPEKAFLPTVHYIRICGAGGLFIVAYNLPVALQELFVGASFMVIQGVANSFGVVASAGVGIAEKVCAFIMLVPSAYMQSLSAFVAQNQGAGKPERARQALYDSLMTAAVAGLFMFFTLYFHGDVLSSLFTRNPEVIEASASYLKAYGVEGFLSPLMFCFIGFFNGCRMTMFVMLQGMLGALCVRVPLALAISRMPGATLFHIGLCTPASSLLQMILCIGMYLWQKKKI